MKLFKRPLLTVTGLIMSLIGVLVFFSFLREDSEQERLQKKIKTNLEARLEISRAISPFIRKSQYPTEMSFELNKLGDNYKITYTLDSTLQGEAEKLLKQYKPDFGAVVLMDASNGRLLSLASFERNPILNTHLALRATYPAASVFKIVTSAAAIDRAGITPEHTISFNGGNYTLYKKNVMSDRINRWTRKITLRDAFARSINTAFGRLSLEALNPEDLTQYAHRFMFNQEIPADFEVEMGLAVVPTEKNYEMTQVASGFNRLNRMSPIQGAMIAASIVNEGKMVIPFLVSDIRNSKDELMYTGETLDRGQILNPESATKLQEMMAMTVLEGTSRKSFRPLVRDRRFKEIELGGKTGHLTGDNPRGRVDWFVGYGYDEENRRVAVAALTVNKEFWTVKSSHLAQTMLKKYFEPIVRSQFSRGTPKRKVANN